MEPSRRRLTAYRTAACEDEALIVLPDTSYRAAKLHDRSRFSWAVIGLPSEAIAVSPAGELLMRLRRDVAERIADQMSETAARAAITH